MPAAQEEHRGQQADGEAIRELAQEEEPEAHAAILDVVAGHQLRLRLRQVEGEVAHLGQAGDEVDQEAQRLWHHKPHRLLRLDDPRQRERAGHQRRPQQRQRHR